MIRPVTVDSATTLRPHGSRDYAVASCRAGMHVIGGYVTANGAGVEQSLEGPDGRDNDAWLGYTKDTSATVNETFTVSAICAHVTYANPGPDLPEESPCTHAACALPLPPR